MPGRELLVNWLKDAHAMEQSLVSVLEDHAEQAKDHPELHRRLTEHKVETEGHREAVERCLRSLNEDPSGGKDIAARMTSALQSTATSVTEDRMVKNALNDYATENFEIACYKALVKGAETLGETEVARECSTILEDEKRMAHFLDQHLDEVVVATV